jgi:carboxymethylenebutenolidase
MCSKHSSGWGSAWKCGLMLFICGMAEANAEVETAFVQLQGGSGPIKGFLARPKGEGPFRAIVLVHEWWGLSDWIKQNAEKLAGQGYVALAVDLYGGQVTTDPGKAHELMRALNQGEAIADLKGGVAFLKSQPFVAKDRKMGAIGWCMGGGYARELAQACNDIGPTVICYGSVTTQDEQISKLVGKPILGIFGEDDQGIPVEKVKQFAQAVKAKTGQGSPVGLHVYKGAGHGFMRPGGPQYNAAAAADAWTRITDFFAESFRK